MRFATLRNGQVVGQSGNGYRVVAPLRSTAGLPTMVDVITHGIADLAFIGDAVEMTEALAPPIASPKKVWAAAGNYHRVRASTPDGRSGRGEATTLTKEELLNSIFLKPSSAIVGPGDSIIIPPSAGSVFPEVELCIVIGKRCRGLSIDEAYSAIFGYTILIDVTARAYGAGKSGKGMRCVRKGYDTFAPIGPVITTRDEIPDPHALGLKLWVNGELRQSASTETMINKVPELVAFLSTVCTLEPGDLIATGTPDSPAHQMAFAEGDVMVGEIEDIGRMQLDIRRAS